MKVQVTDEVRCAVFRMQMLAAELVGGICQTVVRPEFRFAPNGTSASFAELQWIVFEPFPVLPSLPPPLPPAKAMAGAATKPGSGLGDDPPIIKPLMR